MFIIFLSFFEKGGVVGEPWFPTLEPRLQLQLFVMDGRHHGMRNRHH